MLCFFAKPSASVHHKLHLKFSRLFTKRPLMEAWCLASVQRCSSMCSSRIVGVQTPPNSAILTRESSGTPGLLAHHLGTPRLLLLHVCRVCRCCSVPVSAGKQDATWTSYSGAWPCTVCSGESLWLKSRTPCPGVVESYLVQDLPLFSYSIQHLHLRLLPSIAHKPPLVAISYIVRYLPCNLHTTVARDAVMEELLWRTGWSLRTCPRTWTALHTLQHGAPELHSNLTQLHV